ERVEAPEQLVADAERRYAEDAAREPRLGRRAQALLVGVAGRIDARRELGGKRGHALGILGVGAAAPDVTQHLLADEAARRAVLGRGRPGEARETEGIERMARRRVDGNARTVRQPVHLAKGP